MDITKLRLVGLTDVDLPIIGARPSDTYICKAVDGLGPPERDISITNKVYQGLLVQGREIIIRVGLNPNYKINQTASQLRTKLYDLLDPGDDDDILVQLMHFDTVLAQASGIVKRIEIVPFAVEPEVQITVTCPDSYFVGLEELTYAPEGKAEFLVDYTGTAKTGFYLEIDFFAATTNWSFYRTAKPAKKMDIRYSFTSNDKLIVDTRERNLKLEVVRAGSTISLLHALTKDSIWLQLHKGANLFSTNSQNFNWGKVVFTPRYWGI